MNIQKTTAPSPAGEVTLVTFTNDKGASVTLSSLGAAIVAVNVPDREGKLADVVIGYENPADYIADGPCAGKTPAVTPTALPRGTSPSTARPILSTSTTVPITCMAAPTATRTAYGMLLRLLTIASASPLTAPTATPAIPQQ